MTGERATSTPAPPSGYSASALVPAPRPRPPRSEDAGPRLDAVTGLIGAHLFTVALNEQLQRARRAPCTASVLVVDLDLPQELIDGHGRAAEDDFLRALSASISRRLRATDVLARVGDDTFAALLWAADEAGATRVSWDLISVIAKVRVDTPTLTAGGHTGVGLVVLDATTRHAEAILDSAARAVVQAKLAGGSRVVVAGPVHS
jgi:diguanylate cyclase (GGDEF)-like protein